MADTLELFDKRITSDPKILKEVSNLKNVGKGSIAIVSGTCLWLLAAKQQKAEVPAVLNLAQRPC